MVVFCRFQTLLLLSWTALGLGRPAEPDPEDPGDLEDTRSQALKRLLEVFGIQEPPQPPQPLKQPPQYMVDLYNAVAGSDGVTKNPDVLKGNTVRSFLDKDHSTEMHFTFILSSISKDEQVLTANLHLFKLHPRAADGLHPERHHFCQVSVYQVLHQNNFRYPDGTKLLSTKLVSIHGSGWEVFSITQAVRDWTEEESTNLGLLLVVRALGGTPVDADPAVRFASGRDHHESKKPMLVLFTDDGRRGATLPNTFFARPNAVLPRNLAAVNLNGSRSRTPRSAADSQLPCQLHSLLVDFEEIGWNGWVISPRSYNAYHCKGSCTFPLAENMRPTNHATVQSIINALKLNEEVSTPCCVPDKLYSINLLYFDDNENVVLKQYADMVASSCGCH